MFDFVLLIIPCRDQDQIFHNKAVNQLEFEIFRIKGQKKKIKCFASEEHCISMTQLRASQSQKQSEATR